MRASLWNPAEGIEICWQSFEHRGNARVLIAGADLCRWIGVESVSLAGLLLTSRLTSLIPFGLEFAGNTEEIELSEFTFFQLQSHRNHAGSLRVGVHQALTRALSAGDRMVTSTAQIIIAAEAVLWLNLPSGNGAYRSAEEIVVDPVHARLCLKFSPDDEPVVKWFHPIEQFGHGCRWRCHAYREECTMDDIRCKVVLGEVVLPLGELLMLKEGVSLELPCQDRLPVIFEIGTTAVGRGHLTVREGSVEVSIDQLAEFPRQ